MVNSMAHLTIVVAPDLTGAGRPAWSPDARRVVFASRELAEGVSALVVADIATGTMSTLTTRTTNEIDPSWKK